MSLMFLTQVGGILKPFAWIMGIIMNAIYEMVSFLGVHSIAVCVIIFTFVIKMLMLPLTIKQQKSTKLSSRMNPEIAKIQEKYKGKKDEASMRRQQAEMQAVYDKYGTTPMSGCLPLLISLPIMFALYRVIYAIPAYVNDIYAMYGSIADQIMNIQGYGQAILSFMTENMINVNKFKPVIDVITADNGITYNAIAITKENLVDIMYQFNTTSWSVFKDTASWIGNLDATQIIQNYSLGITVDSLQSVDTAAFTALMPNIESAITEIVSVNSFLGGLNILNAPGWSFPGIIIPLLAGGTQFLQSKLMTAANDSQSSVDNPTAQSMKMMNYFMPVMSAVFCAMLPICIGLYWIASSVFGGIQTIFINKYMDKIDVEDLIEANNAKMAKKKAKMGIETGSKMAEVAKTSTKSIQTESPREVKSGYDYKNTASGKSSRGRGEYKRSEVSYSAKSIAANANLIKNNEAKNRDGNVEKEQ